MRKTKKPARQRTKLDQIAAKVRTALRGQTKNVIEIGKLLNESREHLEHGDWQAWLIENFDLSLRTAQNYCSAAEYVVRAKGKSATVADFANLSPSVLYHLAAGHFDERVEAAILAEARKRRVDEDAAWAICEALAPPDDADDADADDDQDDDGGDDTEAAPADDAEIAVIIDGPPPAVPPPAPIPPPTDYTLRDFDQVISVLNRLKTKLSTQFAQTIHSADDLESVASFIRAVMKAKAAAAKGSTEPPR